MTLGYNCLESVERRGEYEERYVGRGRMGVSGERGEEGESGSWASGWGEGGREPSRQFLCGILVRRKIISCIGDLMFV